jgi:predicted dehydrogenase
METTTVTKNFSRRTLLKGAGLAVASPFIVPASVFGDENNVAPNERITVAHIGVGTLGRTVYTWTQQVKDAQSVAVADPYKSRREGIANACKGKAYLDYHDVLARNDIDAVLICTPDHWHVPIALEAGKAGKHVHVAKPLGLSLAQNLVCRKFFAEKKLTFQYGTQQRSMPHCWKGCELVRRGVIGKVTALEVYAPNGGAGGSTAAIPVPADLGEDGYKMWLGNAPAKPFTANRCNPPGTYWIYDYSTGYLGGWGAHPLDIMVWGSEADLSGLMTVQGTGTIPTEGLYDTVYNWDMKIKFGDVPLTFKTGGDRTRFIGEHGWIDVSRGGTPASGLGDSDVWAKAEAKGLKASDPQLLQTKLDDREPILKRTPSANLIDDFIRSIKAGQEPVVGINDAVRSDNISQLCDIAVRTKSVVKWDPVKLELVDATDEQTKIMNRAGV